jgi:hypothetical protein
VYGEYRQFIVQVGTKQISLSGAHSGYFSLAYINVTTRQNKNRERCHIIPGNEQRIDPPTTLKKINHHIPRNQAHFLSLGGPIQEIITVLLLWIPAQP